MLPQFTWYKLYWKLRSGTNVISNEMLTLVRGWPISGTNNVTGNEVIIPAAILLNVIEVPFRTRANQDRLVSTIAEILITSPVVKSARLQEDKILKRNGGIFQNALNLRNSRKDNRSDPSGLHSSDELLSDSSSDEEDLCKNNKFLVKGRKYWANSHC